MVKTYSMATPISKAKRGKKITDGSSLFENIDKNEEESNVEEV